MRHARCLNPSALNETLPINCPRLITSRPDRPTDMQAPLRSDLENLNSGNDVGIVPGGYGRRDGFNALVGSMPRWDFAD